VTKFCIQCGAALNQGARFCGSCGAPVPDSLAVAEPNDVAPVPAPPTAPPPYVAEPEPIAAAPEPDYFEPPVEPSESKRPNWMLIGGVGSILLLLLLYYVIFLRDDIGRIEPPVTTEKVAEKAAVETSYFAVADANIRDKATTVGTTIKGKLLRGTSALGSIITGEDGTTSWLKLAGDKGFIAMSNLSEAEPPKITKLLGDKIWNADTALDIIAQPDTSAPVLDRVAAGTPLTLFGLTANDYVEVKLKRGGVGYIAGGARIEALAAVKGKPIAIAFKPDSCNFGDALEAEFAKLTAKSRAAYKAIDMTDFANDAARDKALIGFEGKSYYQRLERSFNGLSITGIAQHYESQSVYFADAPDKVLAAFKAAGYKIGRDGQFANTEIYAGIGATAGEGRGYGKSDLSCGV
jgi:hypothetical protein